MSEKYDIDFLKASELKSYQYSNPDGVVALMPCIDKAKGLKTAEILSKRAGIACKILVIHDIERQGFIKTINDAVSRIKTRYLVYLAEDAFPGRKWLNSARETMERTGKGLLAFNDGKWKGHIASFGMVRSEWIQPLYGGLLFSPEYKSHQADIELTVIARAQDEFVYDSDATLVEHDPDKDPGFPADPEDRMVFESRFRSGFNGIVSLEKLKDLAMEYEVNLDIQKNKPGITIIVDPAREKALLDRLLSSFKEKNSYPTVELLVIDNSSMAEVERFVDKYSAEISLRLVKIDRNDSPAAARNKAAREAHYSCLLFLSPEIIFTNDVLPLAAAQLQDPNIGVVGMRLDDYFPELSPMDTPSVQHMGIKLVFDPATGSDRPVRISLKSVAEAAKVHSGIYPAVSGEFFLCRKAEFEKMNGFSSQYESGSEDVDFCLRMDSELKKKCLCINEVSLGLGRVKDSRDQDRQNGKSNIVKNLQQKDRELSSPSSFSVVLFWKQNDTTLYGRRSDMIVKYLSSREDVKNVVVVDAPMSKKILKEYRFAEGITQHRLVYERTCQKTLGILDQDKVYYRVFVHNDLGPEEMESKYLRYLKDILCDIGVNPRQSVFWMYPRNNWAPAIIDQLLPACVVTDIVDDHRTWPDVDETEKNMITENYEKILSRSHFASCNCDSMQLAMKKYFADIVTIPNGIDPSPSAIPINDPVFDLLSQKKHSIIGFVGNLEKKIDVSLLLNVIETFNNCDIVFIGSTHANPDILDLDKYPHVHFIGVVPYEQLGNWLSLFDVGLIPHLNNTMTQHMNPLKLFTYLAWNIPVVSTNISNIDTSSGMVFVGNTHETFIRCIEDILHKRIECPSDLQDYYRANSWQDRLKLYVDQILDFMREAGFSDTENFSLIPSKSTLADISGLKYQENASTQSKIEETLLKENELLLLQLHQVQEELEEYYLKYQELKTSPTVKKDILGSSH